MIFGIIGDQSSVAGLSGNQSEITLVDESGSGNDDGLEHIIAPVVCGSVLIVVAIAIGFYLYKRYFNKHFYCKRILWTQIVFYPFYGD